MTHTASWKLRPTQPPRSDGATTVPGLPRGTATGSYVFVRLEFSSEGQQLEATSTEISESRDDLDVELNLPFLTSWLKCHATFL